MRRGDREPLRSDGAGGPLGAVPAARRTHQVDAQRLLETLLDREKLGSTGIGEGVAIPHGKVPGLPGLMASFGRAAGDGLPRHRRAATHLFFALFAPENSAGAHLKALARISRISKNPAFRDAILKASDAAEIYRLIEAEDAKYSRRPRPARV